MYMEVCTVCMYAFICKNVCMYVCTVCICKYVYFNKWRSDRVLVRLGLVYVSMYVCMLVQYVYVCLCEFIYEIHLLVFLIQISDQSFSVICYCGEHGLNHCMYV